MKAIVGIDGSEYGQWALDWIPRLHLRRQPTVLAIHARDLTSLRVPFGVVAELESSIRQQAHVLEQRAATIATETQSWFAKSRLNGTVLVRTGKPARILLSYARRQDLIVVGNRGFYPLERLLIGSVSQTVATNAPCPVLVVKQPARPIRRILLALDGSRWSQKALQWLTQRYRPRTCRIVLSHILPFRRSPDMNKAAHVFLHRYAEQLKSSGYSVTLLVRFGNPAEELTKLSVRERPDLVVAGARGLGAVGRLFVGSVSLKLLHSCPRSLLIVR